MRKNKQNRQSILSNAKIEIQLTAGKDTENLWAYDIGTYHVPYYGHICGSKLNSVENMIDEIRAKLKKRYGSNQISIKSFSEKCISENKITPGEMKVIDKYKEK